MSYERDRGSARRRGYGTRWEKAAATFKQRNPRCLGCAAVGVTTRTDAVDHVEPHKGDQAKFWNSSMWQSACTWHHSVIKQQLERMYEAKEIAQSELWLNSATAQKLSRRQRPQAIGPDGWPA